MPPRRRRPEVLYRASLVAARGATPETAMQPTAIVLPLAVQAGLTLAVLIALGPARAASMRYFNQSLSDTDVRLGQNRWSEQAIKVSNNYRNQFEIPVLFFVAGLLALQTGAVDKPMLVLAWIFVISRIAHALIHIGPNILMLRGSAFGVGVVCVIAMWVRLVLHVL